MKNEVNGALVSVADYRPWQEARALVQQAKEKQARLEAELAEAKKKAEEHAEEAVRLSVLAELGEASAKDASKAEAEAVKARKAVQDLEDALRRVRMEIEVKEKFERRVFDEARALVASNLRRMHREAVRELAAALEKAVQANLRVRDVEDKWLRSGVGSVGLPGALPCLSWPDLLPQLRTQGVILDTKYTQWLKELERYGYAG